MRGNNLISIKGKTECIVMCNAMSGASLRYIVSVGLYIEQTP